MFWSLVLFPGRLDKRDFTEWNYLAFDLDGCLEEATVFLELLLPL
jgi:hypothetical protein